MRSVRARQPLSSFHYWVDGYNLFFRLTHSYLLMKQQHKNLLKKLCHAMQLLGSEMTVVFDGKEKHSTEAIRHNLQDLGIVYTAPFETADQYIMERVLQALVPSQLVVVSSDQELLRQARAQGAHVQTVEAFMERLVHKQKRLMRSRISQNSASKPQAPTPAELQRLLKIFEEREGKDF